MSDVCNHVLKAGLVIDFIFRSYGCLANSSIRVNMHQLKSKRWQLGGKYRVSVALETGLIIPFIAIASVIYTLHPSFQIQTLIKLLHEDMQPFQLGGMLVP